MKRAVELHYAWRGWILALPFAVLACARYYSGNDVRPAWLALALLGAGYRLHAGRYMPAHSNDLRMSGAALAVGGPYRIGRHPLYLANLITAAGLILFSNCLSAWGAAALFVAVFFHHDLLARAEERFLAATRGEKYAGYLRSVPRWLGRARRENAPGGAAMTEAGAAAEGVPGAAPTAGLGEAWARQAANLAKTGAAVLLLWGLAGLRS